ncbi:MAG: acyl CoA:acetate/3-ketoacid CoA transferase [Clostridiales Family XIII bacterium]|jgi:propionate CoA-transferase|nr:acyl CoA:acetate/3-ketoacid CoA transferase [Clostridiales Family XIII bacterium]
MKKLVSAQEAAKLIQSNDTVAVSGFVGIGHPEEIYKAVEERFLSENAPRNLTITTGAGSGDGKNEVGLDRWAKEGLIGKIIATHFNMLPGIVDMIAREKIEAYAIPQGVMLHLYRAIGNRTPGVITSVGLKTFADPRDTGCRLNGISKDEVVALVNLDKEYLWYKAFPINVAVIRGTTADEYGNISMEKEALRLEIFVQALAAKTSGGKVIAQVERYVKRGSLDPKTVIVPGALVDAIVIAAPENHKQSVLESYNPAFTGEVRIPLDSIRPMPLGSRKIIARRAAMELIPDCVLNLGIGIPEGVSAVAAEEGISELLTTTVEPGLHGGVPLAGLNFGAAINPEAVLDHPTQFDFYDSGRLDLACLGMAECDMRGNINVSKFGPRIAGPGGFVNITQSAKCVIFCGTFTASGLKETVEGGKLVIAEEGSAKKFVEKVSHVTFSGEYAKEKGQKVLYITERAVFEIRDGLLTLVEIAPGVDAEKDVFDQMLFRPAVADDLKEMDARIFRDAPMGLAADIAGKAQ